MDFDGRVACNNPPAHTFESPKEMKSDLTPLYVPAAHQAADTVAVSPKYLAELRGPNANIKVTVITVCRYHQNQQT